MPTRRAIVKRISPVRLNCGHSVLGSRGDRFFYFGGSPRLTQPAQPAQPGQEPPPHGAVGVGTWRTDAEFKDIAVTAPDGRTLLKADLTKDASGWRFTGDEWDLQDGVIKPAAADAETWAVTGDAKWTDHTLTLKARETAGREGFLILFHAADADKFGWLNVGGWGNTAAGTEMAEGGDHQPFGPRVPMRVEAGRW